MKTQVPTEPGGLHMREGALTNWKTHGLLQKCGRIVVRSSDFSEEARNLDFCVNPCSFKILAMIGDLSKNAVRANQNMSSGRI